MKNNLLSASILGVGLIVASLIITNGVFAQTAAIQYPVAELGNCKSKDACKAYCDNTSHINACVTFAEKNGIMSPGQLAEAKQVQAAIAKGIKPPACNGKKECDAYCEEPSHMKECIAFGEASGFLKGKELEDAKKMIVAIDNGATPPACKGKEACDAYCSDRDHIEACMTFAQAAGMMTPEEAQNSQKMIDAVKKGFKPPNCKGREECDAYCAESTHIDECIQFSVAAGFMTEKEAEMAKRTGGKGPGGCVGKESCDAFCNNPENQKTCMNFARENGMISEEESKRMEKGQQKFKDSMRNLPTEVADCMKTALGNDSFGKIKDGQMIPPKDMPEKVDSCFSKMGPPREGQPGEGGDISPAGQGRMMAPGYQQTPGTQFVPRIEPNQTQLGEERPPQSEQFAPGTYPNQPPPGGQQAPGTLFVPRVEIEQSNQAPTPLVPQVEQVAPIEQTAPQSFNFDLNSLFAAAITAFQESRF